ncbi:MAG: class I SAM-dependent methyltransferase [Pseudomonadota bacterium]
MTDLKTLYRHRFDESDLPEKNRIWSVLCSDYFNKIIPANATVLDIACGYGEFINNIRAGEKIAIDANPDAQRFTREDIEFHNRMVDEISVVGNARVDIAFTSNFLEHLRSKSDLDKLFVDLKSVLKPGGKFIIMGPNIRYVFDKYWDFYDHYLPLSHLSLEEGLVQAGYEIDTVIPKFLPYSTRSALPKASFLVAAYLRVPIAWQILGRQFLVIAKNPDKSS